MSHRSHLAAHISTPGANVDPAATSTHERIERMLAGLFLACMEIVAGVRPVEHVSRWVTAPLLDKLRIRAELERQQRQIAREGARRPGLHIHRTLVRPSYHHRRIECLVVFDNHHGRTRVATAVFERSHTQRWLLSDFAVL